MGAKRKSGPRSSVLGPRLNRAGRSDTLGPRTEDSSRPIGIFDSGVGGLTVFREIARALPRESLIYLGDSARVPYGAKSAETVIRYSLEAAKHLLSRDIKMLVVACNTATAAALPTLQS